MSTSICNNLTNLQRFFALPVEEKSKYVFSLDKNIGWESGRQKRQSFNLPELKASGALYFKICTLCEILSTTILQESLQIKWHGMDEDNKWPTEILEFRAKMEVCRLSSNFIAPEI